MRQDYCKPAIRTENSMETSALACAKTPDSFYGSWHFSSAYDTFTGHLGGGFGGSESLTGSAGIGWGPGGTSMTTTYLGSMCGNCVTYSS